MSRGQSTSTTIPPALRETLSWLIRVEDYPSARAVLKTATRFLSDRDPSATDFIAHFLMQSKSYPEAAEWALKTLELLPKSAEALFNAAKCLNSARRPAEAESLIREAIRLAPDWDSARLDLALYVGMQGRNEEALEILQETLKRLPEGDRNRDAIRFNLGWHHLREGRFKEGMAGLHQGRALKVWGSPRGPFARPALEPGGSLAGKRLLIVGEGGQGDEVIAARFGELIRARGGTSAFCASHALVSLLSRAPGFAAVVPLGAPVAFQFDLWAPAMDLPYLLGLEQAELPSRPYLSADPRHVEKWRERIPARPGELRVGLRWQGNPLYEHDLMRSVPFRDLEALLDVPHVKFYSLQRDEGSEELKAGAPVTDLGPELRSWEDTAAAIENLDLIITSCTSVAHVAAAMGKPTWLLCPLNCYYVWATPGDRSPWYPSVTLYRQNRYDSWEEPVSRVRRDLMAR